jgi:hypothetical protein
MRKKYIIILLAVFGFGILSCKKSGDFTTDKDTYKQGEVITITNTTEKASKYYKWTFGGVEIEGEAPVYTIPENTPIGSFTITVLPVNSLNTTDNWKKSSRTVMIEEAEKAKAIFFLPKPYWPNGTNESCTITLTVDGTDLSETITVNASIPDCDSNNNLSAATFDNLKSGTYSYIVDGSSSTGSYYLFGSIELEDGFDCRLIDVSKL